MQYPITITEYPHQGAPRTWTLWDHTHLMRCIDWHGREFTDWANAEEITHWSEQEDGHWELLNHDAVYNVENFIDFLQRDLKKIEVKEVE